MGGGRGGVPFHFETQNSSLDLCRKVCVRENEGFVCACVYVQGVAQLERARAHTRA